MKANEAVESYPIQFKDKIDEYLWKEHHILGGCCSSIESMKYAIAREVAEKLTDAFIDKASIWFNNNFVVHDEFSVMSDSFNTIEEMSEDFRNYMKGE